MKYTKEQKLKAIFYFLNEVMNTNYSLEIRKSEMLKIGSKFCRGFPEWSDVWGVNLKEIDDISKQELNGLLDEIE